MNNFLLRILRYFIISMLSGPVCLAFILMTFFQMEGFNNLFETSQLLWVICFLPCLALSTLVSILDVWFDKTLK